MGRRFQHGARRGLRRQVIPLLCRLAQRPFLCDVEGAKNNLEFTGDDFFGDKDVCSIVLEVPNSALGTKSFTCGRELLRQVKAAAGSKWNAEPGLRKQSYLSKREMPTSEVNPRTMSASLLPSRTLWSTQVDIRRLRRSAWRGHCSQMFCLMTLLAQRLFPITAGHSPTMRSILLFASSQMKGHGGQRRATRRSVTRVSLCGPPHQSRVTKAPHRATAMQNQT